MQISKGKTPGARKCLLYGVKGIGKSTWAAASPQPLFINLEDGLNDIDCHKTAWLDAYEGVLDCVGWMLREQHEYRTVVIDSADWLERLIFKKVAAAASKNAIEEIGYGKGYQTAAEHLLYLCRGLDTLRGRGVNVVFLAHERSAKILPPGGESYEQYMPDLHKEMAAVLTEWCDEVLFAHYETFTKKEDLGFNKTRSIAVGGTNRIVQCSQSAAATAKNRLRMPETIPMEWSAYQAYWAQPEANISGVVVNGSSKRSA